MALLCSHPCVCMRMCTYMCVCVCEYTARGVRRNVCGSFPCSMLLCKAQLSGGDLNMSQCHASVSVWFYMTSFILCSPLHGLFLARHTR